MLVHFPSALFPFELICSFLAYYTADKMFAVTSFYAMSGGVIMGWFAATFGAMDVYNALREKPLAMKVLFIHGIINICVLFVYTVLAYSQFKIYPEIKTDSMSVLIVKASVIIMMMTGNYFGGSLILKYKIAVGCKN